MGGHNGSGCIKSEFGETYEWMHLLLSGKVGVGGFEKSGPYANIPDSSTNLSAPSINRIRTALSDCGA